MIPSHLGTKLVLFSNTGSNREPERPSGPQVNFRPREKGACSPALRAGPCLEENQDPSVLRVFGFVCKNFLFLFANTAPCCGQESQLEAWGEEVTGINQEEQALLGAGPGWPRAQVPAADKTSTAHQYFTPSVHKTSWNDFTSSHCLLPATTCVTYDGPALVGLEAFDRNTGSRTCPAGLPSPLPARTPTSE